MKQFSFTITKKSVLFLLYITFLSMTTSCKSTDSQSLVFKKGQTIVYNVTDDNPLVVQSALYMLGEDFKNVLDASLQKGEEEQASLVIRTLDSDDEFAQKHEAFRISIKAEKIYITGSDANGTAYGIMELSRMMGVSPWVWWADSPSPKLSKWAIPINTDIEESPMVPYRGIFINDEDWGLCPWSWKTFDPSDVSGRIGPKTHERIFQLLLRLRANMFWPAMHECSVPFFLVEGNREMADRYGIRIGTSHCEPMQRNTNGEWKIAGVGAYEYVNNAENVYKFWEERVKEVAQSDNYFTLGMRGVHDGKMRGVDTVEEQRDVLNRVFKDQRELIEKYVNKDVTKVPQVFIPYKEVLDIYNLGLHVPDDVTLMWCDDNYGYMKYLPNKEEQNRKGGNGMYYHISYWGRPHDYLWLASTSPALIQTEFERAYNHNTLQLWVINVGDIKPGEYLLEYCMDMAWNKDVLLNRNTNDHMKMWYSREFGDKIAEKLVPLWNEYYTLSYRCRPEFMGNTRVEESDPKYMVVKDLPWTDSEVKERLKRCQKLESEIQKLSSTIDPENQAQWYQLVEYPILSFCAMNRKMLGGQLARHGEASWEEALKGYNDIVEMAEKYNAQVNGKWNRMMDYKPRNLPVFLPLDTTITSQPLAELIGKQWILTPSNGKFSSSSYTVKELGYSREALVLTKGDSFSTMIPSSADSLCVTLAFLPTHPAGADKLTVQVEIDGETTKEINYETYGRSEEWKINVLYNQAHRKICIPPSNKERKISIQALTPAVILDEVIINEQ